MANNTVRFALGFGSDDLASLSNASITLELKFGNEYLASMADANIKTTFVLAYDPVQGLSVQRPATIQRIAHTSLPHPPAPVSESQESRVEQGSAAEPQHNSVIPTQTTGNDSNQTNDDDWERETVAALLAMKHGDLPAQEPLGKFFSCFEVVVWPS